MPIIVLINYIKKLRFSVFFIFTLSLVINLQTTPVVANQCLGNVAGSGHSGAMVVIGSQDVEFFHDEGMTRSAGFLSPGDTFNGTNWAGRGPNGTNIVYWDSRTLRASACNISLYNPPDIPKG